MNMKLTKKKTPELGEHFIVVRRSEYEVGEFSFHVRYANGEEKYLCHAEPDICIDEAFARAALALENL